MDVTLNRSPSKLKMVECKQLLGCKDTEWSEIGAIVLHIVTFLLTCFSYWRSRKNSNYRRYHGRIKNTKQQQQQRLTEYHFLNHISQRLEKMIDTVMKLSNE